MFKIKSGQNFQCLNSNVSQKQMQYEMGYKAVQGGKEQQERAQKLVSDLKAKFGGNVPSVYVKLATILSKDKNATVDDVLNTYKQLSQKQNGQTILSPSGVEEILNDFICDIGRDRISFEAYLNSDYITISSIQYALEQWSKGVEYHIPTQPKVKESSDAQENVTITPDNVFKHMEQNLLGKNIVIHRTKK